MKKIKITVIFSILFSLLVIYASAQTERDITSLCQISCQGINADKILDDSIATKSGGNNVSIDIQSPEPIGGVYIEYSKIPTKGTLSNGKEIAQNGFMHEFIDTNGENEITLNYDSAEICTLRVYSVGEADKSVQRWQSPNNKTDILLCATHSDDDQLFFAGLLPYYSRFEDVNLTVAYFINHYDTYNRTHELLNGLWHCGVKNYPIISPFPDGYSENKQGALNYLSSKGFSYDDVLDFQKSLLNKYRPKVVVLHDFNGEYGHGAHILNTYSFVEVCENYDENQYIPLKIYVHLYDKNQIILDIDSSLDEYSGKSAFNISQEAFGFHHSQHWTWFYNWIYGKNGSITKAEEIRSYNPAKYGLYYSSVGEDLLKNDLLENIETYSATERRLLEEERQRLLKEQQEKEILLKSETEDDVPTNNAPVSVSDNNAFNSFIVYIIVAIFIIICFIIFAKIKSQKTARSETIEKH